MTLVEAIQTTDRLKPNDYSFEEKVAWLSELDGIIRREIIDVREGAPEEEFAGYGPETDDDTVLVVYAPYEEIYPTWLGNKIDFYNQEAALYNNSAIRYNDLLNAFRNDYNRHHSAKRVRYNWF